MSNEYLKKYVLHMTSIKNIEAILASGTLMAKSVLPRPAVGVTGRSETFESRSRPQAG
ncbi:hypothetical protein MNBD_GAMMA03-1810 [hydrothermal vent metagenome]|uniref:Uncharacterized protein n=1 Tax=hydrothermal vent metagenome TaxID=652676 RepID=A0A3B0WCX3_9ZZZZ